jgi:AraC family transcriptional regulator
MYFTTCSYRPNSTLELHARASAYLSVVIAGSYTERVGSHTLECLPLSVRLHAQGEEHAHRFGNAGARCFNLELDDRWHDSLERLRQASPRPLLAGWARAWSLNVGWDCAYAASQPGDLEEVAAALLDLCERQACVDRATERSRGIRRAIDMIHQDANAPLSLTVLAAEAGLHPTHFARSFKAWTGQTAGEYLRRARVSHAQQLLAKHADMTISRVAAASGFADHAHLTRTFRAEVGVSPSRYRALLARQ